MSPDRPTVSDADVRALAAKLKGLHALLSPGEAALLDAVLRRAVDTTSAVFADATGFAWAVSFNPLPSLDAVAADLQRQCGG